MGILDIGRPLYNEHSTQEGEIIIVHRSDFVVTSFYSVFQTKRKLAWLPSDLPSGVLTTAELKLLSLAPFPQII